MVRGWSSENDQQAERYLLASNQLTIAGGWDTQELVDMLEQLAERDALSGTGFGTEDLNELLASLQPAVPEARTGPDDVPEPPPVPVTKRGDLWLLGPHRVLCGDATNESDHAVVLCGERADLVLTDPPYGADVDYGSMVDDSANAVRLLVGRFMPLVLQHLRALVTPGQFCLWDYPRPGWLLAWVHPAGSGSGPWGFTTLNPILGYGPDPYLELGLGRRADTLVLAADREGEETGHPVAKPIKVWEWLLERGSAREGELIFDPFLGSGTTLIAAHRLRRRCYGIEIEPRWVDAICRRFEAHTGITPVLEATGQPRSFAGNG